LIPYAIIMFDVVHLPEVYSIYTTFWSWLYLCLQDIGCH